MNRYPREAPGAPGKTDGGNPFESVPSSGKSTPSAGKGGVMDPIIAKLSSNEHFKKQEGLKEAQSAKVDEGSRAAVLEALLKLCSDSDIHQKVELLKAYKKWATTQEDKEKLGEHAEVFIKDHWAKKDALRYFGENKVISASKEVAYLLKDNFDRKDAAETLIAMGSDAEKAVIPHLTDLEPQVRQMAIEVLARIGTPACIPDLQKLKSDRFVGRAASQAITLINGRKK
ncbi:MAG: HEAT repeat domain-containing protein [Gemmatales bacterium]